MTHLEKRTNEWMKKNVVLFILLPALFSSSFAFANEQAHFHRTASTVLSINTNWPAPSRS